MGKKVNPLIFRISNIKNPAITWHAQWIAKKNQFAKYLQEDEMIRKSIKSQTRDVGIDKVIIQRSGKEEMEKIIDLAKKAGAQGIKISMAGRLNGVEIARYEKLATGKMPLQNLRANIDYARGAASTKWGQIGIKVWVYKGEVFESESDQALT